MRVIILKEVKVKVCLLRHIILPIKNQRKRKPRCGKKFGGKCKRRQQKNKKMLKRNRLPKKFAKSKVRKRTEYDKFKIEIFLTFN